MMSRPLLVVALLVSLAFAGCIRGGDEPIDAGSENETVGPGSSESLPTGQQFTALEETNKTEEGFGGVDHKHDYWHGKEQITIYDYDVDSSIVPVFERGDESKVFIGFVNLEEVPGEEGTDDKPGRDALVYEGTGLVTFTITSSPAWASDYQMSFRTAAKDWSEWIPIKVGVPFEYVPDKIDTDMPHSFRSLWNWKLQATGPVALTGETPATLFGDRVSQSPLHVTIVVTKARDVDDWPGHPAFYDGTEERFVVREAQGRTNVQQAADVLVYGVEPDQIVPDRLISMGTRYLDVYVNITNLEMPPGIESDGFTLFWRTAATQPSQLGYNPGNNDTDGTTWAYWHLTLKDDELDSPYQPTSRFSFKVLANPANSDLARCYRCIPYNIEYTMTVIARPDPDAVPMEME